MVADMSTVPVFLKIDADRVRDSLQGAIGRMQSTENEAVLDFSSVRRIDASDLEMMQELANMAEARGVKLAVCGVNVKIYKVLKLARISPRLGFVTTAACVQRRELP
jgi:anti-anti-sigma regulatory factor